jgi:hypothetical protein
MEPQSPTLMMWSKLVDLHVFHDNLKQERLRRFMPFQLGLMAGFALSVMQLIAPTYPFSVPDVGYRIIWFTFALGFCYMGFNYARRTMAIDTRNAEYARTIKNQLRHFEQRLKPLFGDIDFMPYEGQFKVLNEHSVHLDSNGDYLIPRSSRSEPARIDHLGEHEDDAVEHMSAEDAPRRRRSSSRRRTSGKYFMDFTHVARPAAFHEARILQVVSWTWVASLACLLMTSAFVFNFIHWRM